MENFQRNVMKAIKMDRVKLLDIVRANKETHIKEFKESVDDYKKLVLSICERNSEFARTGSLEEFKSIRAMPPVPVSYEDSYKRAIRMLELSVEATIDVEEDVFNQLVLDEWSWKRSFTTNSTMYKSG